VLRAASREKSNETKEIAMNFENILATELARRIAVLLEERLRAKKSESIVAVSKRSDIKKHVLMRDGFRCQWCAMGEGEHIEKYGIPLIVSDSDGFRYKKRECNPDQLRTLCCVCRSRRAAAAQRLGRTA